MHILKAFTYIVLTTFSMGVVSWTSSDSSGYASSQSSLDNLSSSENIGLKTNEIAGTCWSRRDMGVIQEYRFYTDGLYEKTALYITMNTLMRTRGNWVNINDGIEMRSNELITTLKIGNTSRQYYESLNKARLIGDGNLLQFYYFSTPSINPSNPDLIWRRVACARSPQR